MSKIEIKGKEKNFYVLVGKKFAVYDSKEEAVADLKTEMKTTQNAIVALLSYVNSKEDGKQGTFNVEPLGWKEIAMGLLKEGS